MKYKSYILMAFSVLVIAIMGCQENKPEQPATTVDPLLGGWTGSQWQNPNQNYNYPPSTSTSCGTATITVNGSNMATLPAVMNQMNTWSFSATSYGSSYCTYTLTATVSPQPPTLSLTGSGTSSITVNWTPSAMDAQTYRSGTIQVSATPTSTSGISGYNSPSSQSFTWNFSQGGFLPGGGLMGLGNGLMGFGDTTDTLKQRAKLSAMFGAISGLMSGGLGGALSGAANAALNSLGASNNSMNGSLYNPNLTNQGGFIGLQNGGLLGNSTLGTGINSLASCQMLQVQTGRCDAPCIFMYNQCVDSRLMQ